MAEQFDWSKVLERMREEELPAKPAPPPPATVKPPVEGDDWVPQAVNGASVAPPATVGTVAPVPRPEASAPASPATSAEAVAKPPVEGDDWIPQPVNALSTPPPVSTSPDPVKPMPSEDRVARPVNSGLSAPPVVSPPPRLVSTPPLADPLVPQVPPAQVEPVATVAPPVVAPAPEPISSDSTEPCVDSTVETPEEARLSDAPVLEATPSICAEPDVDAAPSIEEVQEAQPTVEDGPVASTPIDGGATSTVLDSQVEVQAVEECDPAVKDASGSGQGTADLMTTAPVSAETSQVEWAREPETAAQVEPSVEVVSTPAVDPVMEETGCEAASGYEGQPVDGPSLEGAGENLTGWGDRLLRSSVATDPGADAASRFERDDHRFDQMVEEAKSAQPLVGPDSGQPDALVSDAVGDRELTPREVEVLAFDGLLGSDDPDPEQVSLGPCDPVPGETAFAGQDQDIEPNLEEVHNHPVESEEQSDAQVYVVESTHGESACDTPEGRQTTQDDGTHDEPEVVSASSEEDDPCGEHEEVIEEASAPAEVLDASVGQDDQGVAVASEGAAVVKDKTRKKRTPVFLYMPPVVEAPAEESVANVDGEGDDASHEIKVIKANNPMTFGLQDKRLGAALMDVRAVTREQLEKALEQQVETAEPLGRILVRMGFVTVGKILQVVSMQRGIGVWDLETEPPRHEAMDLVAGETCNELGVLPVALKGDLLVLAMGDPDDFAAIDRVREETNLRVEAVLADPERLAALVRRNYHLDSRTSSVLDSLVDRALKVASDSHPQALLEHNTLTEEETRPVVGFVNQIIHDAIRMHASDIHVEPRFNHAEIRYRLDGQLVTMREVPQALVPMVVTRLKIMAELDIVEYRVPQDGRMALQLGNNTIDLRVSCLPSLHGQRVVMRVLDKSVGLRRLDDLGFDPENLSILRSLVEKPYGLLLATGPTGSGKTTTLYAAIQELKRDGMNIMTCEDPVEYDLEGVNQSQVNEKVGLTFAEQLRAILRQDPDIVLVGEIRDQETAETAVRAAMTGHMVLSTLHCNDAPSAIARLLDLGIDPFLLSTSLIGTMSQRLVRRLCPHCKQEDAPTQAETELMEKHFGVLGVTKIWRAAGCEKCHNMGYKGRVAVSEMMPVVEEISNMIATRAPLEKIKAAAALYGYLSMQGDAMVRVARGETSLDEAKRTVFFDTIQRRAEPRQIAV